MPKFGKKPSLWEMALQHIIVFLICVVFPGATTMFAPATWITMTRSGDEVHCTARTCVFFILPFKTQQVASVSKVTHHEKAGETKRQVTHGRTTGKYVHVDGEGFLVIHGNGDQKAEVSVSPVSIENVVLRMTRFLDSNDEKTKTLFAIANWKFGGIMGGVLSLFTLLYVVGYSIEFLKLIFSSLGHREI